MTALKMVFKGSTLVFKGNTLDAGPLTQDQTVIWRRFVGVVGKAFSLSK